MQQTTINWQLADIEYDLRKEQLLLNNNTGNHVRSSRNHSPLLTACPTSSSSSHEHLLVQSVRQLIEKKKNLTDVYQQKANQNYVHTVAHERSLQARCDSLTLKHKLLRLPRQQHAEQHAAQRRQTSSSKRMLSVDTTVNDEIREKILQWVADDQEALLKWHHAKVEYDRVVSHHHLQHAATCGAPSNATVLQQWFPFFQQASAKRECEQLNLNKSKSSSMSNSEKIQGANNKEEDGKRIEDATTTATVEHSSSGGGTVCFRPTCTANGSELCFRSRQGYSTVTVRVQAALLPQDHQDDSSIVTSISLTPTTTSFDTNSMILFLNEQKPCVAQVFHFIKHMVWPAMEVVNSSVVVMNAVTAYLEAEEMNIGTTIVAGIVADIVAGIVTIEKNIEDETGAMV